MVSTSAGLSVSTTAWVSCSPSITDSASHGHARRLPSRVAPLGVGSQTASAYRENASVRHALGRCAGRWKQARRVRRFRYPASQATRTGSHALDGSSSRRLLGIWLVLSLGAVEDGGAGLFGVREDLVDPALRCGRRG